MRLRTERASCPDTASEGGRMYQKPTLQRFGALRELTLAGLTNDGDGIGSGFISTNCSTPFIGDVGCPGGRS